MTDFIVGAWLTITIVIIGYMVVLGRKQNRLEVRLVKEETRSVTEDKNHSKELNKINIELRSINGKMDDVLSAVRKQKTMYNGVHSIMIQQKELLDGLSD